MVDATTTCMAGESDATERRTDRRTFLKRLAVAAAGGAVLMWASPTLSQASAATSGSTCKCVTVWNGSAWTSHYHCTAPDGKVTCKGACPS